MEKKLVNSEEESQWVFIVNHAAFIIVKGETNIDKVLVK